MQAPVYQIINDGKFGDLDFSEKFWRVSASNKEEDFSNVNQMSLALLSRFSHLEVAPDNKEIINHFLEKGVDERIIGYLNNYEEDFFPKKWDDNLMINKANPFPRQWEYASNLIKDLEVRGNEDTIRCLVASCVGGETATRFMAFSKMADKIKIDELIATPEKLKSFENDQQRVSIYYSIISSIAVKWFAKDKKVSPEKLVAICANLPVEMSTSLLKMIADCKTNNFGALLKVAGGKELFTKVHELSS